jgi:hypothetical protein
MSKPAPRTSQASVDALTRDLPPQMRAALSELASLIRSTVPGTTEKVNPGWRSLNFYHPDVGYFCWLFPFEDRIDVAYEFGVLIADPEGILDSGKDSKQVRFARIRSAESMPREALERLLRAAVSLPADRATRIALARSGAKPV